MSKSIYKKWMKESYLYEDEDTDDKDNDGEDETPAFYDKNGMDIDTTGGLGDDEESSDEPLGDEDENQEESIKVINGKKYRAIQESVNKRIRVKEVYKWLKTLEEYRYRKIPGVDARRITSFVNNGLNETDLPISLQKKWESATYSKEKTLADRFMKERINRKLTQNESNHPLKEQYNKLFKNKVVL